MKKYLFVFLLFLFTIVFTVNGANLIQNPSFEDWSGDTLNVWTVDASATIAKESTDVHSGSFAIDITTTSTSNKGVWQMVPVTGGAEYIYSVWVKANGTGSNGIGILVTWRSADSSYMSSSSTKYNSVSLAWEYVCDTVVVPDTAAIADLKIRGYMNNGDAGIVDDADFELAAGGINERKTSENMLNLDYCDQTVKINMSRLTTVTVRIFDMAGNIKLKKQVTGSDMFKTHLNRGVYFIVAGSGKNEVVKKAIVLR